MDSHNEFLAAVMPVTTIFRREDGEWKIIHRHGDAVPDGDSDATLLQLSRFGELDSTPDDAG
ncbi:hypothetical protein [Arthrobacter sp. SO3]|uniref:hypothetical protein n=1 Tax=Arthrobacter sp. SO3 TaxID=1897057 RepID=UPI001CFFD2D0|nr:hypothetical protein [Arthrobacter sp. SO3]MCB5292064.1 hypothetical protein [Arthrobacter sp. SO3]